MNQAPQKQTFLKKLLPLALAQFFGVFNDNAFKMTIVMAAMSLNKEYSGDAGFISLSIIAFVLPFILFANPAGYLADKFRKRHTLVFAKLAELFIMLMGAVALGMVKVWGLAPLICCLFLMATQSAFFSPAFNGILPEIFSEEELSKANGNIGMITFLAVIIGFGSGIILKYSMGDALYKCGLIFSFFSLCGLISVGMITPGNPTNKTRRWTWNFLKEYISGFKLIRKSRAVFLAIAGEAYFLALGTIVQSLLLIYGKYTLRLTSELDWGILQLTLAVGMGLGCYLAGKLSGNKVELGLVPFGSLGLVIFLFLTALYPGEHLAVSLSIGSRKLLFNIYPPACIFLVLLGISGGLFVIPLRTYIQQYTDKKERGTILANANVLEFGAILLSGLIMMLFTAGAETGDTVSGKMWGVQKYLFSIDPVIFMIGLSVVTLFVSIYVFSLLPEFAIRFAIVILSHTIYKIRVKGAENIPEQGPALLVANHVSFVDWLLIMGCTSRFIRFLMHEDYYRYPLLYPIVKWANFIEVPAGRSPKRIREAFERTKSALKNGEIVCIFPEGKITRNGIMGEFKAGIMHMIPEGINIPIIPVRLGMLWGSIFSYYYGRIRFRFPKELPHPASVTFGKPVYGQPSPFELRQMISELAAETEMTPRPEERPMHYQFSKHMKRAPFERLIYDSEGNSITNFSLFVSSMVLSREILRIEKERNIYEKSEYVGVLLPNSIAAATATLSVLLADRVPAMLNFSASQETLEAAINKADIGIILTSKLFLRKTKLQKSKEMVFLEDIAKHIPKSKRIFAALCAAILPHQEIMNWLAPNSHRDVFKTGVLLFSSGSTGDPKGVMLSHHNINSNVYSFLRIMGWRHEDKLIGNLPLFHSFGFTTSFWLPLMSRCQVIYTPNPLDGNEIVKTIHKFGITVLLATPTFLQIYMKKASREQLSSLRLVIAGAEKLRNEIAEKFKELTGLSVTEGYGCTELSPVVSINVANSIMDLGVRAGKPGSVGVAMPGICVKIVDLDSNKDLPPGEEGVMFVKGPNVMQGYLNDPQKTKEVIKNKWYDTSDIAKMDTDGYIFICGRLSRFSKIAGEMVPHELIEEKIQGFLKENERKIIVCGVPDKAKGEKLVVLYTELAISPKEIVEKMREQKLPNLWIPRPENFYRIDEIPVLGSGKLNIKKIKDIAVNIIPKSVARK